VPQPVTAGELEYGATQQRLDVAWLCGIVLFLEGYDIAAVGTPLNCTGVRVAGNAPAVARSKSDCRVIPARIRTHHGSALGNQPA
jgi:hypothetical protein